MANKIEIQIDVKDLDSAAILRKLSGNFDELGRKAADSLNTSQKSAANLTNALTKLSSNNALGVLTREAAAGAKASAALQNEIRKLQQEVSKTSNPKLIVSIGKEADIAKAKLAELGRERLRLEQRAAMSGGASTGASAASSGIRNSLQEAASGASSLAGGLSELKTAFAAGAVVNFGRESVLAFAKAGDAARVLESSGVEVGLSYTELTKKAADFGRVVGQSEADAQRTFASITRFAGQAGRSAELDQFSKRFADLTAARGFGAEKIPDFINQLVTGQDEVFDRLLKGNPSKYYDEFAKSIGTTGDKLTDLQKTQVRFDAVMKGGAIFSGEAEKRAISLSGSIDNLSAGFEDFKKNLGKKIEGPANSLAGVLSAALTGKSNPVIEKLLGISPDGGKGTASIIADMDIKAKAIGEKFDKGDAELAEALKKPSANFQNFALSIANEKFQTEHLSLATLSIDDPKRSAQAIFARREEVIAEAVGQAEKLRDDLKKALEDTAKDDKSSVFLLRLAIKEVDTRGGIFGFEEQSKIRRDLEKALDAQIKPGLEKVKEIGKAGKDIFKDLNQQANVDNPFVRVFDAANSRLELVRANTKGLGQDLQDAAVQMARTINAKDLYGTRIDNALSALDLREQAKDFRAGGVADAPDSRRNPFSDEQLRQLAIGDKNKLFNNDPFGFREYLNKEGQFIDDAAKQAFTIREKVLAYAQNTRIGDRSIEALAGLTVDLQRGDAAVDPNKRIQERLQEQFDTIARVSTKGLNLTEDQQASIADKRIIGITSGLQPGQLDFRQSEGAAAARDREATRREKFEDEGRKTEAALLDTTKAMNKNLLKLIQVVQQEGLKGLEVVLKNETGDSIRPELTPAPQPKLTGESGGASIDLFGSSGGLSNR